MTKPLLSPAVEDYLKAIYKLQSGEENVTTSALASQMNTTAAAVTKMMKQLDKLHLVEHTPYYGVRLTEAGQKIALEMLRHHRLLELYLAQALGYPWDQVDAEADRLEHHISEEFEDKIDAMLDYPLHDPHGDPIPTKEGHVVHLPLRSLDQFASGEKGVIRRVKDSDPQILRFLGERGLYPRTFLEVVEKPPYGGSLTILVTDERHAIPLSIASHVFLEPVEVQIESE